MARYSENSGEGFEEKLERTIEKAGKNIKKVIFCGVLGLAAIIGGCQLWYSVPTDSQGVVRRLGAYVRTTEPGLHFKIPYFIEKVDKVPIRKVQREEFGFRTIKSGIRSEFLDYENADEETRKILREEYLMLTGDLNMADIEFLVQYKIKDPVAYSFNIREPSATIRDCSLAIMKQLAGDGSVDEAITIGRVENEIKAEEALQKMLDEYNTGIDVVAVKLQSCNPPRAVRGSFNEVNQAMQQKEKRVNEARQEYNNVIPKAKGEAEQLIKTAEGFAIERVNKAKGDVQKFNKMLEEYVKAPEITRTRLYFETMEKVLPGLEKTIVEQKGAEGGILLKLNLDETASGGNIK